MNEDRPTSTHSTDTTEPPIGPDDGEQGGPMRFHASQGGRHTTPTVDAGA